MGYPVFINTRFYDAVFCKFFNICLTNHGVFFFPYRTGKMNNLSVARIDAVMCIEFFRSFDINMVPGHKFIFFFVE